MHHERDPFGGGWGSWGRLVLKSLEDHDERLGRHDERLSNHGSEIEKLKADLSQLKDDHQYRRQLALAIVAGFVSLLVALVSLLKP